MYNLAKKAANTVMLLTRKTAMGVISALTKQLEHFTISNTHKKMPSSNKCLT